ncbi:MAG: hypothetical protein K2N26_04785, partial [Oscillospiraceae bacterium]|nr:hypothetical protein [Oscillospiraceae bacterium]
FSIGGFGFRPKTYPLKTVHRTVFKIYFYMNRYKEGRSCSPLLETLSRFSPPLRFERYALYYLG